MLLLEKHLQCEEPVSVVSLFIPVALHLRSSALPTVRGLAKVVVAFSLRPQGSPGPLL